MGREDDASAVIPWSDLAGPLPRMPLSLLRAHGAHGLVAVRGVIFDVREDVTSPSIKPLLGHDITRCLAKRVPVDAPDLEAYLDQVGDLAARSH